ncbi:MAG: MoaD/ThiS family protein [Xanthomonadales bacterium]|nr:MoaD/ThiS family protein [Xanthomonadales bacterium]
MKYRLLYFGALGECAGMAEESVTSETSLLLELYAQLRQRHGFGIEPARLRVAINGEFADWQQALRDGDEIVFLPPVSGG